MGKASKSSFKKVAAGVLAVITLASYSLPANTGILSNRPTLSANATGTENSIHVYGKLRNATGETLKVIYNPQNSNHMSQKYDFKDGEVWSFDGDITAIYSPVKLVFPSFWNTDFQKIDGTPHVDDITNEELTEDGYVYTFNSPKGNTYQYENMTYGEREVIFTKRGDYTDNGDGTHTDPFDNTIEKHNTTEFEVTSETKGNYGFEELSPGLWRSNNYGKYYSSTTNAKTTFKVNVPQGHSVDLNYWVSCEEGIDYLKLTIDGDEVFKQDKGRLIDGATNRSSGVFTLVPGKTHTIVAEYCHYKDPSDEAISETARFLDAAYIQFSSPCSKCDYTPVRAYMQFDRFYKGQIGVENGEHIAPTLTWGNTGKKYWAERKCSVYSNDSLYFDCAENNFTVTENIGNFTYDSVKYHHRYDIEIPNPELGVFIDVSEGYYDDTNYLFSCKAKKGVTTDLSKLTLNDFVITMDPELDKEEAERLKAVIESDETIKWLKTFTNGAVYYVIYNPELAEFDEWDDTAFISYGIFDLSKYEITDSDIVSPVDLITLDKNGKAYPNTFVKVVAENADGTSSELVENTDFKFVSGAASHSGEFTVELNGINSCTGNASKTMTVVAADELTKVEAKASGPNGYGNIEYYTVDDRFFLPVEGYANGYKEVSEEDVLIEGTATMVSDDFIVPAVDLIVLDKNGKASPNKYVSVVDADNTELTEGTDYEFVSADSTNKSGSFTVEISGIGNYAGTASKAVSVAAASDITKVEAKSAGVGVAGNIEYYTAGGKFYLPVEGYENGYKEVSEADVTIDAIILDISDDFIVPAVDLIVLDKNGKASPNKYVSIVGTDAAELTEGKDYEFVSAASTTKSGEFKVEINGLGGYTGTASKVMNVAAADYLTKVEAKAAERGVDGNIEYYTADGKFYLPVEGYENGYKEVSEADVIIAAEPFVEPAFKTQNLVLSGQIGVNFFLDLSGLTDEEKAASYVDFTVNDQKTTDTFDESFKNQSGEYYGFTCYVNSVQMADTITAVFHYGDKTVEKTYSVLEYVNAVEKIADKLEPEMAALVQSIADYGHYAQPMLSDTNKWTIGVDHAEMTKYYTESYDHDEIKAATEKYAHKSDLVKSDIDKITYSLSLNAETALNVFVAPNKDYSGDVAISIDGLSENDYTVTKQESDGRYKIVISNISAHKLGNIYNIKVTTDNGVSTYNVSALSFVYAVLDNNYSTAYKDAASSIYKYFEATMTYRNK